jgi:hypothetical protein
MRTRLMNFGVPDGAAERLLQIAPPRSPGASPCHLNSPNRRIRDPYVWWCALIVSACVTSVCWAQARTVIPPIPKIAVTTYHYDNFRTGWNSREEILNPTLRACSNFYCAPVVFGLRARVALDDTVYAQPLIVPDVTISGGSNPGKHDVVYVVTENNSIYAIDANNGEILLFRNLGPAVPAPGSSGAPPGLPSCRAGGARIGIESAPVIDLASRTMYLMSYKNYETDFSGIPIRIPSYWLHAIDLATLNDKLQPVYVSASHKLDDGRTLDFIPALHRQRAALLLADGNVYAAFTSWCDLTDSRGWLLGWRAADLQPLAANTLPDTQSMSTLSTIWMSGYGVAADAGHLYFVTGNSDRTGVCNGQSNLCQSVVKVSADLTQVLDFFRPSNINTLGLDMDFGSGGVLLLPDQPGLVPHTAAAAGKDGLMYLIDRDNMGRGDDIRPVRGRCADLDTATDHVLDKQCIGPCWCGQSYYLNNIVSSGGQQIGVWQVKVDPIRPSLPKLTQIHSSTDLGGSTDNGGFFTSISSNGDADVIIWAVSGRNNKLGTELGRPPPNLFAFQPMPGTSELKKLFQSVAGKWDMQLPDGKPVDANSNIVPVVANGHVYVASNGELDIFGFVPELAKAPSAPDIQSVSGIITTVSGSQFTLKTETGAEVRVEAEVAIEKGFAPELLVGQAVNVSGNVDAQRLLHADVIKPARTAKKP